MENQNRDSVQNVPLSSEVFQRPPRKKNKILSALLAVLTCLLIVGVGGYFYLGYQNEKSKSGKQEATTSGDETQLSNNGDKNPTYVLSAQFAKYIETPVHINPSIASYRVNRNLDGVTNKGDFQVSEDAKTLLSKNSFVVIPAGGQEFYPLYEKNTYNKVPSFITTDSMLHSYHLMFDNLLKKLEEDKLTPELKKLNASMLADSLQQYDTLKGTEWEDAARRNVGFFAVGSKLLDPGVQTPDIVKSEVEQELSLIEAHAGVNFSPVMNIGAEQAGIADKTQEDYSQYVPRGHYTKTDALKAYFKSMMWYGRLTFRLSNEGEVKSALLINLAVSSKGSNRESWDKIYEPINFFVGKSDDITYYQMREVMQNVYGNNLTLEKLTTDKAGFTSFMSEVNNLQAPQINSMPIFNANIQPDRTKAIKGFRFLGQRFTIDASIFQRLIVREVGRKEDQCSAAPFTAGRTLPKGLDIPAAMGSTEAYNILQAEGDTDYACYKENMSKMQTYIAGLDTSVWTQNLYWGWLYSLQPLTKAQDKGYPSFMTNVAWQRKNLNTYLGSWTELKRDTILYSKQSYAEMGGGGDEEPKDYRGYVEPEPYVYARLASLIEMTKTGLMDRGVLDQDKKDNLDKLKELAISLKTISEKELNRTALSDDENNLIKSYGGNLEHIWYDVFSADGKPELDDNSNAPVVADVATDPGSGSVLEEGNGYVSEIYVIVPIDGKLRMTKGAVYSHYEFLQPMENRLSDESWKALLKDAAKTPPLPAWTSVFITK